MGGKGGSTAGSAGAAGSSGGVSGAGGNAGGQGGAAGEECGGAVCGPNSYCAACQGPDGVSLICLPEGVAC